MTEPNPPNLLWVNKDATNLHTKKHATEVNAHVQRKGSRKDTLDGTSRSNSLSSLRRVDKIRRRSSQTPPMTKYGDGADQQAMFASVTDSHQAVSQSLDEFDQSLIVPNLVLQDAVDSIDYDVRSLSIIAQMAYVDDHVVKLHHETSDIENPLPGLISGLSHHDQMLIHTYLTYLPQTLFGLQDHPTSCPIRSASIVNMTGDPLGLLWVLISLDMFLAKAQRPNDYDARILQRKNQAYQLMAMRLGSSQEPHSMGFIVGTGSAALAELFFGDPKKGVMHLSAVEAVLISKGGTRAIATLPQTVTIPLMGAFAYQTLFRDGLGSVDRFTTAHSELMQTLRSFLEHNRDSDDTRSNQCSSPTVTREEENTSDANILPEQSSNLGRTKQRIFVQGSLMHKFIQPDLHYVKPSDQVDHFILLYTINIALLDFRQEYQHASRFLEEVAEDINSAGSSRSVDSSLKISGARSVVISRHAQVFAPDTSEGVARAWGAISAFEILKYLSADSRSKIIQTLSGLLTSDRNMVMSSQDLAGIDAEASAKWWRTNGTDKP